MVNVPLETSKVNKQRRKIWQKTLARSYSAQLTTTACLVQKTHSTFCSWVCSSSDHILSTNEQLQCSFESITGLDL